MLSTRRQSPPCCFLQYYFWYKLGFHWLSGHAAGSCCWLVCGWALTNTPMWSACFWQEDCETAAFPLIYCYFQIPSLLLLEKLEESCLSISVIGAPTLSWPFSMMVMYLAHNSFARGFGAVSTTLHHEENARVAVISRRFFLCFCDTQKRDGACFPSCFIVSITVLAWGVRAHKWLREISVCLWVFLMQLCILGRQSLAWRSSTYVDCY